VSLDGVRERVEARGAEAVSSGSKSATRKAALGSPQAIFACVRSSEMRA
jgi:hypothetical protein